MRISLWPQFCHHWLLQRLSLCSLVLSHRYQTIWMSFLTWKEGSAGPSQWIPRSTMPVCSGHCWCHQMTTVRLNIDPCGLLTRKQGISNLPGQDGKRGSDTGIWQKLHPCCTQKFQSGPILKSGLEVSRFFLLAWLTKFYIFETGLWWKLCENELDYLEVLFARAIGQYDTFSPEIAPTNLSLTLSWQNYRKISNISHTKSQNFNDSRLVLHLSLSNLLKPGVK